MPEMSSEYPGIRFGYGDLYKEKTSEGYRRQIVNVVNGRYEASYNTYQTQLMKTARRYDMYRGFYQGRYHSFRNNINIPLIFSIIQSDVAHKVQTSFGIWPIVEMHGYGPEDAPTARKNTVLISAQIRNFYAFPCTR